MLKSHHVPIRKQKKNAIHKIKYYKIKTEHEFYSDAISEGRECDETGDFSRF